MNPKQSPKLVVDLGEIQNTYSVIAELFTLHFNRGVIYENNPHDELLNPNSPMVFGASVIPNSFNVISNQNLELIVDFQVVIDTANGERIRDMAIKCNSI